MTDVRSFLTGLYNFGRASRGVTFSEIVRDEECFLTEFGKFDSKYENEQ